METNTVVWIIVAVVAVLIVAVVMVAARKARDRRRHVQAERIREEVNQESERADRREAIALEAEAKARAAHAEAEAKAAEAARLQNTAASHREAVNVTREDLEARREHADSLDPRSPDRTDAVTADEMHPDMHPGVAGEERSRAAATAQDRPRHR
ncbi:MAG: hypothetical protein JST91_22250 [Actinobacteria bacterium]|nr:hypothetical protein [Actinomycetota bacterium]